LIKTEIQGGIMPRPTTQKALIEQAKTEYHKLEVLLGSLQEHDITSQLVTSQWTTKDVLAHLTQWQQMAHGWYNMGLKGETPALPAPGYNWRQIPELNQRIYQKHKDTPLKDVQKNFKQTHQETLALLEQLSDTELFEKSHFSWTNQNNLATYMISVTSSHYKWAYSRIWRILKSSQGAARARSFTRASGVYLSGG
jgi:hypothetical protein